MSCIMREKWNTNMVASNRRAWCTLVYILKKGKLCHLFANLRAFLELEHMYFSVEYFFERDLIHDNVLAWSSLDGRSFALHPICLKICVKAMWKPSKISVLCGLVRITAASGCRGLTYELPTCMCFRFCKVLRETWKLAWQDILDKTWRHYISSSASCDYRITSKLPAKKI